MTDFSKRLGFSSSLSTVLFFGFFMLFAALYSSAHAQNLSGRGIDMRALQGQAAQCRGPALNLLQRSYVLRQSIADILECNASGGFFQGDGTCVPAVSPAHLFDERSGTNDPQDRSRLSFVEDGNFNVFGIIGGLDGNNIQCAPVDEPPECAPGYTDPVCCDVLPGQGAPDICDDGELPCEEDPTHPDYPECGEGETTCPNPCAPPNYLSVGEVTNVWKTDRDCDSGSVYSTALTCQADGTMTNAPWEYQCTQPPQPDGCEGCPAATKTWVVGGNTCRGDITAANTGETRTANNFLEEVNGSATFQCEDGGDWGDPIDPVCDADSQEPQWTWVNTYGTVEYSDPPEMVQYFADSNCGPIWRVNNAGETTIPFQSCIPGNACSGDSEITCLINRRPCVLESGGPENGSVGKTAYVWDRYECQ